MKNTTAAVNALGVATVPVAAPVFLLSELFDQAVRRCLRPLSGPLGGRALLPSTKERTERKYAPQA